MLVVEILVWTEDPMRILVAKYDSSFFVSVKGVDVGIGYPVRTKDSIGILVAK